MATPSPLPPPSESVSSQMWDPLPPEAWDAEHARHLLRRMGWTADPAEVDRAVHDGLGATLNRLFPAANRPPAWPLPAQIAALRQTVEEEFRATHDLSEPERRQRRSRLQQQLRSAQQTLALDWLQQARQVEHAAFTKWILFLGDVYVISAQKVKNPLFVHEHDRILRQHALGAAPALTKAVSRSPAMVVYLDLQQSRHDAPNENFARELFELFVLGEGHYTEGDIKEAARAFTGYRQRGGEFAFARRQHDTSRKTVFGHIGPFTGDEVIDLAYRQPAAATFLPTELARFYLTSEPLPTPWIDALGTWWRDHDFNLRALALQFFGSRAFYAPEFRGDFIKSPVQFYLGLLQDLQLDVLPAPRFTLNALRAMGQIPFQPPNVRGWVGGRQWINSTTLAARRQTARFLVEGLPESLLNADEVRAMQAAREAGLGPFTLPSTELTSVRRSTPVDTVEHWSEQWLSAPPPAGALDSLADLLADDAPDATAEALITFLQSPDYNLC